VVIKHTGDTAAAGRHLARLRREAAVLSALAPLDLPVPTPLLFVELEREQGAEGWLVTRRLPGISVCQVLRSDAEPQRREALLIHLGQTLARLHATPAPAALAAPGNDWLEEMLRQAAENFPLFETDGNEALLERLHRERPSPIRPALIHGDLFMDNVLADGVRVSGLIDWAFGGVGDPRYDLAVAIHMF
jgi:aminoglycoside 3'-phosphotransferase-2